MPAKVFLEKCNTYDFEKIKLIISRGIESSCGIKNLKNIGKKVLLKPNVLCKSEPDECITTHPIIIRAVAEYFLENGFHVYIGDSPAIEKLNKCLKSQSLKDLFNKPNVRLADFDNFVIKKNKKSKLVKQFNIAAAVDEVDFIVNLPKLKTHSMTNYTGALKNMFGLIPGLQKSKFHFRFPERDLFSKMIVDLNETVPAKLTIIDAVEAMQGEGPRNGRPYHLGLIGISKDPAAIDFTCSKIIGYKPEEIKIIKEAINRKNNWIDSESEIEYINDAIDEFIVNDFELIKVNKDIDFIDKYVPKVVYNFIRNLIVPRPVVNDQKCKLCRKCEKICAADAIKFNSEKNYMVLDYEKCIRCFCCHEICPYDSIMLKKTVIGQKK